MEKIHILDSEIAELIEKERDGLEDGDANDISTYKEKCGYIKALRYVRVLIKDKIEEKKEGSVDDVN